MVRSFATKALAASFAASAVSGFGIGTQQSETHPKMQWKTCTGKGGSSCTNKSGEIVIDSNWRWLHTTSGTTNCYTGNKWDSSLCSTNSACSSNCVMDGADYSSMSSYKPFPLLRGVANHLT
jgi:cellulose 1,4-beta-cellobiosidase